MDRLGALLVKLIAQALGWVIGTILGFIIGTVKQAFFSWRENQGIANPKHRVLDFETRFAHTHVCAGSGHGKTQFLQQLLLDDLDWVKQKGASVVVIDSQGDLIHKITHLASMRELADRLILIDPNDTEFPPALNLFDVGLDRLTTYDRTAQDRLRNSAVSMYKYIFGTLFGAEMTQRQSLLFGYLARLLVVVPGATIYTLREFLEYPERIRPHFTKLDRNAREFFESQYFQPKFDANREQILNRLWSILENDSLARMFEHEKNKINLFDAMNRGSLILINTAKDLLKQEGCEIFGRFFITLLMQAVQERAAIPENKRLPVMVYIDEAQDYIDDSMEQLFIQARKYKVGLLIAHQHLGQLGGYRATILTNTAIKVVGGLSDEDARVFAKEMRSTVEQLQDLHKREREGFSEFACFIRNQMTEPIRTMVPLGLMERQPKLTEAEYTALLEANRKRYSDVLPQELVRPDTGQVSPDVQPDPV